VSSPKQDGYQVLRISSSGVLHTSAELRTDARDAQFIFSDGAPAAISGEHRQIWAWTNVFGGDGGPCTYLIFFVGTSEHYKNAPKDKDGGPPLSPCKAS
jgi:hypothetical protein